MSIYKSAFSGAQMDDTFDKVQNKRITAADVGAVPATRKVNNKELSADVALNASDVGAVPAVTGTVNIRVNSATGSDATGDGTTANPYQTFDRAWQDVPMFLNGKNVYIYLVGSFTFGSDRYMCPVGGNLSVARWGDADYPVFTLGTGQNVFFQGANMLTFSRVDFHSSAEKSGSLTTESGDYGFANCNFSGLNYAANCNTRSRAQIYSCTFTDNNVAISAQYGASVGVYAATGSGNNTGYHALRGGLIGFTGDNLQATRLYNHSLGGFIKNAGVDISNGISVATTPPTSALANDAQVQVYDA